MNEDVEKEVGKDRMKEEGREGRKKGGQEGKSAQNIGRKSEEFNITEINNRNLYLKKRN